MTEPVGLVTGSQPFAGLPSNPAADVLSSFDGTVIGGIRIVARATPVSLAQLPTLLPSLVAEHRPVFVLALGLALGAPLPRVEMMAINATHFTMADNEGAAPLGGRPIDPAGPDGCRATWDGAAVVSAILDAGIPARLSFHAGTHLCNLTLYTYLRALSPNVPCGFLHLPYRPEQIVWMMRRARGMSDTAPGTSVEMPSMALKTQLRAVRAALGVLTSTHQTPSLSLEPIEP